MAQHHPFEQTSIIQPAELDTILIARERQSKRFHLLLRAWQLRLSQRLLNLDQDRIPGPVVLIHGESGFGKSTLLRQYHQIAQAARPFIRVSHIMDQKDTPDRGAGLFAVEIDPEIEAIHYFAWLQRQIALALQKKDYVFKNYNVALKEVQQTRKELSRALDRETNIYTHRFAGFAKHVHKEKAQESPPQLKLAQALGADLRQIAHRAPLLLFFDTYERIDEDDPLLRNVMYASGQRVGWIIAGQDDCWNAGQQARRGLAEAAGYQKHVLPEYAFSVELNPGTGGDFTVADIQAYFAEVCKLQPTLPPLDTDDAQLVRQITHGIPQAVRLSAEIYLRKPDIRAITTGSEDMLNIAEKMTQLYLSHIPDIPSIRAKLYGLASLRHSTNTRAVQQALEFGEGQEDDANSIQFHMHRQYGFVLTENEQPTLRENVRHFLRRHLLEGDYNPDQTQVLTLLQQTQQEQLEALEKQRSYPDLFSRLADDTWIEAYLNLVEAQCWTDLYQAMRSSLAFLLGAGLYRQEVCPVLFAIVQPFEHKIAQPYLNWWQIAIRALFYPPQQIQDVAPTIDRLERIEQLIEQQKLTFPSPLAAYTPQLRATQTWQKGEIYRHYDEQKALFYYQTALAVFYQGKAYDEHLAQLYWILAYHQSQKQAYHQSIAYLRQALLLKPDFAAAHYNLGNAYYASGHYDAALTNYHYAIELEPTNLDAWVNLGNTQLQRKNYQQAIQEYTYVLRFEPCDAQLYFSRANTYKKDQAYPRALKDFNTALGLDPSYVAAYVNRGNTYAALKMPLQAFNDYQKACELAPNDIHPAWMREWIRFEKELPGPEVVYRLETLTRTDPTHYVAAICRGVAQGLQTRKLKTVLVELDQAAALAPEQWDPYFWRCILHAFLGRHLLAQEDLQRALENGLPDLLLLPLYWLQKRQPDFFALYARPILERANL